MKLFMIKYLFTLITVMFFSMSSVLLSQNKNHSLKTPGQITKNTALLVIDIQYAQFPVFNQESVLNNINELVGKAEKANIPIIYFQFNDEGGFANGSGGWKMPASLKIKDSAIVIQKNHPDSFIGTNLNDILLKHKIDRVVVAGLQSQYCIKETCIGARELGYNVILIKDAHSNNSPNAEKIISNVHNYVMNNNVATLLSTTKIIF